MWLCCALQSAHARFCGFGNRVTNRIEPRIMISLSDVFKPNRTVRWYLYSAATFILPISHDEQEISGHYTIVPIAQSAVLNTCFIRRKNGG